MENQPHRGVAPPHHHPRAARGRVRGARSRSCTRAGPRRRRAGLPELDRPCVCADSRSPDRPGGHRADDPHRRSSRLRRRDGGQAPAGEDVRRERRARRRAEPERRSRSARHRDRDARPGGARTPDRGGGARTDRDTVAHLCARRQRDVATSPRPRRRECPGADADADDQACRRRSRRGRDRRRHRGNGPRHAR